MNTIIYFLVQIIASSVIIILVSSQNISFINELSILICLIINIGVWPFHLWYISVLSNISIESNSIVLLITWQNLIPAILISLLDIENSSNVTIIIICLISILIPITNINNIQNNIIMALSSLANNSWIIIAALISTTTLTCMIAIYTLILTSTLTNLNINTISILNDINILIFYLVLFANLSGIPPLSIFWVKVNIITSICYNLINTNFMVTIMIVSCAIVSIYLLILMPMLINTNNNTQNNIITNSNNFFFITTIIYSLGISLFTILPLA